MVVNKTAMWPERSHDDQIRALVDAWRSPTMPALFEFADNATALTAGLKPGDLYHTAGTVKVVTP